MMLKKLIAVGMAGATMLAVAAPTFATGGFDWSNMFKNHTTVTVTNQNVTVSTEVGAVADTGANYQKMEGQSGMNWMPSLMGGSQSSTPVQKMTTGDATAKTDSNVSVGTTFMPMCNCANDKGNVDVSVTNRYLTVVTSAMSGAYTGANTQKMTPSTHHVERSMWGMGGSLNGSQDMTTGDAKSETMSDVVVGYTDFSVSN